MLLVLSTMGDLKPSSYHRVEHNSDGFITTQWSLGEGKSNLEWVADLQVDLLLDRNMAISRSGLARHET